ncbi:molybdopterin converting factor subunit 1 [Paenibacillus motobuensis]|uniref:molybdopterin converting factor subunit 1 n=1 Tax=Paenibacillus TaxID=44249 RepID=UPI00203B7868|nr:MULTISPECIES: molybdopterin converting factor subunit 1 [Paenibacillus]MCM3038800.1 molybdopterin converting factor subunit 1 [Paenibacillus lutimineralis]MCM3645904.1 molybdopterin converting factor subunit 1 [Paenibacillus motobuensis]
MKIEISLFAGLAERLGTSRISLNCSESSLTAERLKKLLSDAYPDASPLISAAMVAVNQEYAAANCPIQETDEIALIPPVSGG